MVKLSTKRTPKPERTSRSSPQDTWKGFANIELPSSAKEIIVNESTESEALERSIDSLLVAGYKFSLTYDANSGCYIATATGQAGAGVSSGYAVSSRSEDITRACLATAYKVFELADGDLSAFARSSNRASEI